MRTGLLVAGLAAAALMAGTAQAAVTVTYENPGVTHTTATFDVVGEENFDNRPTGVGGFATNFGANGVITGQYSATTQVNPFDQYGGEGNTNYAVTFNSGGYTLDITSTQDPSGVTYFGYYLSALDPGNFLELYSGNTLIYSFTPAQVLAAINGRADKADFFGKPDGTHEGNNSGEPYVFVNFYSDTAFNKIKFYEGPNYGGGYESDNHTVGYFTEQGGNAVPEPATWALMIMGFGGAGAALRCKRRSPLAA